ncbi:MAG: COX15/CtaA family protein [Pararhizobium sp.]
MTTFNVAASDSIERPRHRVLADRRWVQAWLILVMLSIFGLVIVGGATRLTHSGLSITQWNPIHGVIPPLNHAQWQEEFDLYKKIPEYQQLNKGMTLPEFKGIFWWEWSHRLLARSVGVIFALPLLFFWLTGRIENRLKLPLVGILALGGLQGFIGWWMVSSGLVDRTDVSQYRLATHLTLACIIFSSTAWVMRGLARPSTERPAPRGLVWLGGLTALLVLIQIYIGGLVAGLDAGFSFNTWPLMDGAIIPGDLFPITPLWHNFFENPKLVQLVHRMSAYTVWTFAFIQMIATLWLAGGTRHARRAVFLFGLVTLQAILGIATLVMRVPFDVALTHQAGAIVVLAFAIIHWRGLAGEYPLPKDAEA